MEIETPVFFHRMDNCNRRRIGKIKIGDSTLEKGEEIKSGIANFYDSLFREGGWGKSSSCE